MICDLFRCANFSRSTNLGRCGPCALRSSDRTMDRNLRLLEILLHQFRPLFLAIATGLLAITASAAASDPPPGMTQGQFDSLVAEVSETVARSLASRGFAPSATPAKAGSEGDAIADRVTELVEKFPKVVGAIPGLSGQTVRIMMRLDRSPAGGYSTPVFFALLAGCCLAIVMLALGFLRAFEAMHARRAGRKRRRQRSRPSQALRSSTSWRSP